MANTRSSNTYYIDGTASTLPVANIKVTHIVVTASSASAILVLSDVTSGNKRCDLRVATSGDSKLFDFSDNPLVFPTGISPTTVTNCVATLLIVESRG